MKTYYLLGLFAASLLVPSCERSNRGARTTEGAGDCRTVVLITVDTWRRDATGFIGGLDPSPTPFLDRLAKDGLVLSDAMAPVPLTGPSHWSVLTGRWPWRDGVRVNGDKPKERLGSTLPEILQGEGWQTAGFVSCSALDHRLGFAAGFEHYDDRFYAGGGLRDVEMAERRGDATVEAALSWLAARPPDERIFLWVHLFDPHFPYTSPEGPFPGHHAGYRGEVAFADRQLERLAAGLEASGRPLEGSLWVVLSDHGEGLGAHAERSHGLILHGATTRIPFLVAGPSIAAGSVESPTSTVDVLPTILAYLGLETPECDGIDILDGSGVAERAIPLESILGARGFGLAPAVGLRVKNWMWEASPHDHLWDLDTDPGEERDLAGERAETVASLRRIREKIGIANLEEAPPQDQKTIERMRLLGYVASGSKAGSGDVRAFLQEGAEWCFQSTTLGKKGDYAKAEVLVKKCLERQPRSLDMWIEAGFIAVGLGDLAEAEKRFRTALDIKADDIRARLNLANVLLQRNRLGEAEEAYRKILQADPQDPFALYNLGAMLSAQKRNVEAARYWRRFRDLYPYHPRAAAVGSILAEWSLATDSE